MALASLVMRSTTTLATLLRLNRLTGDTPRPSRFERRLSKPRARPVVIIIPIGYAS
jgi:hypothetical protein